MLCKNCGNEISDEKKFCGVCGARVEVAEADASDLNPGDGVPETKDVPTDNIYAEPLDIESGKKGKKFKVPKFVIPIVLVVAMVVSVCAHPVLRNMFWKTVLSEEGYFEHVMENSSEDFAESFVGAVGEFKKFAKGEIPAVSGSATVTLGEGGKELISKYGDSKASDYIDWIDTASLNFDAGISGDVSGISAGLSVNDEHIVGAEAVVEDKVIYLSVPELNDKAVMIDFSNIPDMSGGMYSIYTQQEFTALISNLAEVIPDDKVLEEFIVRYVEVIAKSVEEVDEETVTINAGGVEQKVTAMTVTLDSEFLVNAVEAVIEEAKEDEDLEKMIVDIAEAMNIDGDEVYGEFMDILDESDDMMDEARENLNSDFEFEMTFYANNKGELVGCSLEVDGGEISFYTTKDGKKYGQLIEINAGKGQKIAIEGSGEIKNGKYNGKLTLEAMGAELVEMTFENVDKKLYNKGVFNGKATLKVAEGLGGMAKMMSDDEAEVMEMLSDISLEYKSASTETVADCTIAAYMNKDLIASVNLKAKNSTDKTFKVPGKTVDAFDEREMNAWGEETEDNSMNLLQNLTKAGLPLRIFGD